MISFTESQINAWLATLAWPFIRTLALFTAMPIFSRRNIPMRLRVALAAFIAVVIQPMLPTMPVVPLDSAVAFSIVAQQVLIGVAIGFAVRVVFAAVEFAGELIGLQMGLNFAGFFDPVTASQGTSVSAFFSTMVAWVFIALNGHAVVLWALAGSFESFPVSPEPFAFLRQTQPYRWGAEIFATGLWIALPVVTMVLFANLVLGFISRVAPQIQVFAVGFPITLGLGLLGMYYVIPMLEQPFVLALERVLASMR